MADIVSVSIVIGDGVQSPAVSVSRAETVNITDPDREGTVLAAMGLVERLAGEVKDEALRQTNVIRENMMRDARS